MEYLATTKCFLPRRQHYYVIAKRTQRRTAQFAGGTLGNRPLGDFA